MTTDALADSIGRVAQATADVEFIAAVKGKLEAEERRLKELKAAWVAAMTEHLEATGTSLTIGVVKYYLGIARETVGNEAMEADTLEALLTAGNGDWQAVASCLRSQPFRVTACKALLPEAEYTRLFSIRERTVLKEGVPKKQLCSVNTQFIKQGSGQ